MSPEVTEPHPPMPSEMIADKMAAQLQTEAAAAAGNPELEAAVLAKQAHERSLPGLSSVDAETHGKLVDHFNDDVVVARNIYGDDGKPAGQTFQEGGWFLKAVDMNEGNPYVVFGNKDKAEEKRLLRQSAQPAMFPLVRPPLSQHRMVMREIPVRPRPDVFYSNLRFRP